MNEQAIQFLKTLGGVLAFVNVMAIIAGGYVALLIYTFEAISLDAAKQICKATLILNAAIIILFSIYYYITGGQDFR